MTRTWVARYQGQKFPLRECGAGREKQRGKSKWNVTREAN